MTDSKKPTSPSSSGGGTPACTTTSTCSITSISIKSITFLSDHNLLQDYDRDWRNGGSRYPKPEWIPSTQHPISHTMDENIQLKIELEVNGANAETGDILGEGPNGMKFSAKGVNFQHGMPPLTLTSDTKLAKEIQELDLSIKWSVKNISAPITPTQTKNTVFVTMDTPRTQPRRPGITLKRMRQAVQDTASTRSLNPHTIVNRIMSRWGSFNLAVVYDNAWELADNPTLGADCQTIVRYTQNIIDMVGCPGISEFIVVWAKVPTPTKGEENLGTIPNVTRPPQWYNDFNPTVASRARWFAGLVDHGDGLNNYEACLRFEHGGTKKYYAGGVGVKNNANEVIKVFKKMAWLSPAPPVTGGLKIEDTIHTY